MVVSVQNVGSSIPSAVSKFTYKIVVKNVQTASQSLGGGYLMTITGENFSEGEDTNNVFIGAGMNAFCSIKSVTSTEIVC